MIEFYSIFLLFMFSISPSTALTYNVEVRRYSAFPIISKTLGAKSDFYTSAALYTDENNNIGVILEGKHYGVTNSAFYHSTITFKNGIPFATQPSANPVFNISSVMSYPTITKYNELYCVLFRNNNNKLNIAITSNPKDPNEWITDGIITPLSTSYIAAYAAPLFATAENGLKQNYLIWSPVSSPYIFNGNSPIQNPSVWTYSGSSFVRQYAFDEYYVQPGNPPLQLKTGDFLHVYNGYGSGYIWNLGYVILNKENPNTVTQRSNVSILSPKLDWEIGNSTATSFLTPKSIYLTGLLHDKINCPEENDWTQCFFGLYSGASTHIGAIKIIVSWQ